MPDQTVNASALGLASALQAPSVAVVGGVKRTLRGTRSATTLSASTTITGVTVKKGHALLVYAGYKTATIATVDLAGTALTALGSQDNGTSARCQIWALFNAPADITGTLTLTTSGGVTTKWAVMAVEWEGLIAAPFDRFKSAASAGTVTAVSSGASSVTQQARELLIGVCATNGSILDAPIAWTGGFTFGDRAGNDSIEVQEGWAIVNAAAAYTAAGTLPIARASVCILTTYRRNANVIVLPAALRITGSVRTPSFPTGSQTVTPQPINAAAIIDLHVSEAPNVINRMNVTVTALAVAAAVALAPQTNIRITPSVATCAASVASPQTISGARVALPPVTSASASVPTPVGARGTVTMQPAAVTVSLSVATLSVVPGTASAKPPVTSAAAQTPTPSLGLHNPDRTPTALLLSMSLPAPSVTQALYDIYPHALTLQSSVLVPEASTEAQIAKPQAVAAAGAVPVQTLALPATLAPNALATIVELHPVSVLIAPITATPFAVTAGASVAAPQAVVGAVQMSPAALTVTSVLGVPFAFPAGQIVGADALSLSAAGLAPDASTGPPVVRPPALALETAVQPPTLPVLVLPDALSLSITLAAPGVFAEASPDIVSAAAAVLIPSVQVGTRSASPAPCGAAGSVLDPTVGLAFYVDALSVSASVRTPDVQTEPGQISPATLVASLALPAPQVVPEAQTVAPDSVLLAAAAGIPGLIREAVTALPSTVPANAACLVPVVQVGARITEPSTAEASASIVEPSAAVGAVTALPGALVLVASLPELAGQAQVALPGTTESTSSALPPAAIAGTMVVAPDPVGGAASVAEPSTILTLYVVALGLSAEAKVPGVQTEAGQIFPNAGVIEFGIATPTLVPEPITVSASALVIATDQPAPQVVREAATATPSATESSASAPEPSATSAIVLAPGPAGAAASALEPSIVIGGITVEPDALGLVLELVIPGAGEQTSHPSALDSQASALAPNVLLGVATLEPAAVTLVTLMTEPQLGFSQFPDVLALSLGLSAPVIEVSSVQVVAESLVVSITQPEPELLLEAIVALPAPADAVAEIPVPAGVSPPFTAEPGVLSLSVVAGVPVVSGAGLLVAPPLLELGLALPGPQAIAGAVEATPSAVVLATSAATPTAGTTQLAEPDSVSALAELGAPDVALGTATAQPGAGLLALAVPQPTVLQTLSPDALVLSPAVAAPEATTPPSVASPDALGLVGALPAPVVEEQESFPTPDALVLAVGLQAPAVQRGTVTAMPAVLDAAATPLNPQAQNGTVGATPAAADAESLVLQPQVVVGAYVATPASLNLSTAVPAATPVPGARTALPEPIDAAGTVAAPTGIVTVGILGLVVEAQAPAVVAGVVTPQPQALDAVATAAQPTVSAGPVAVHPAALSQSAVVPAPLVYSRDFTVAPAALSLRLLHPTPAVVPEGTEAAPPELVARLTGKVLSELDTDLPPYHGPQVVIQAVLRPSGPAPLDDLDSRSRLVAGPTSSASGTLSVVSDAVVPGTADASIDHVRFCAIGSKPVSAGSVATASASRFVYVLPSGIGISQAAGDPFPSSADGSTFGWFISVPILRQPNGAPWSWAAVSSIASITVEQDFTLGAAAYFVLGVAEVWVEVYGLHRQPATQFTAPIAFQGAPSTRMRIPSRIEPRETEHVNGSGKALQVVTIAPHES